MQVSSLVAQPHVDFMNLHERMIAVVPVIGSGTYEDPRRPLFAPAPGQTVPGMISFSWKPSDDGKLAIVEYVMQSKEALQAIQSDARVVKAFEKGKSRLAEMETELRKYRKDYRFRKVLDGRAE